MAELTRFELYYNGNVHCGGLVSSHDDTGLPGHDYPTYMRAVREFNNALAVPPYYKLGEDNRAFFTPEGYARFEHVIRNLVRAIHEHCEGWEVRTIRATVPQEYVLYEDEYQKIVDLHYYQQIMKEEEYA